MEGIYWGVIIFGLLSIILAHVVVRQLMDQDARTFIRFTCFTSLTLILTLMVVFPIDLYFVTMYHMNKDIIESIYRILYICILGFLIIILPYSYFAEEERANAFMYGDFSLSDTKVHLKAIRKYFIFGICSFLLLSSALAINGIRYGWYKSELSFVQWINNMIDINGGGESVWMFLVAIVLFIGTFSWLHASIGIGFITITMLMGDINFDKWISYSSFLDRGSRDISSNLLSRNDNESIWDEEIPPVVTDTNRRKERLLFILKSLQRSFGFILLACYMLYIISLVTTSLDKAINSLCGWTCGFALEKVSFFNILDQFLLLLSYAFPLDIVLISFIQILMFISVLQGVIISGIGFLFYRIYDVESRSTEPHILVLVCVLMLLSGVTMHFQMLTFAPQYTTYGLQKDINGFPCALMLPSQECESTAIATLINKVIWNNPFAGDTTLIASFLVSIMAFISFFVFGFREVRRRYNEEKQYYLYTSPFTSRFRDRGMRIANTA